MHLLTIVACPGVPEPASVESEPDGVDPELVDPEVVLPGLPVEPVDGFD